MKEACKVNSVFEIVMFEDPVGNIAQLSKKGVSIETLKEKYNNKLINEKIIRGNIFLLEGINFIWKAVCGEITIPFDHEHAHIGVGDGTEPADPSQKGLVGANKCYAPMDEGYPKIENERIIFRATFDPTMANFTWNEWTIANGSSDDAINLNRKVESLGTKRNDQSWIVTVSLSIWSE